MKNKLYLLSALSLAFIIRIISLNQSLWLDEAIEVWAVRQHSLLQLFTQFLPTDFNPPGMYVFHWFWIRIFGFSEIWLRMPSVLFGVATIGIIYFWIKELNFSHFAKLISLGLTIFSPLLVYYSQEARVYSALVFWVLTSMYFFYKLFLKKNQPINLIIYILATILLLWSHYLGWLVLVAQFVFLISNWGEFKIKKQLIYGYIIVFITSLPLFWLLQKQLLVGQQTMHNLSNWNSLFNLSWHNLGLFPAKFLIGRIPVDFVWWQVLIIASFWLFLGYFLYSGFKNHRKDMILRLLAIWLGVPMILGILISTRVSILSYFRFIFLLPALYLLIGYFSTKIKSVYLQILALVFLGISIFSTFTYLINSNYHREDWRALVQNLNKFPQQYPAVIISKIDAPFNYYNSNRLQTYSYDQIDITKSFNNLWLIKYAQPIFEQDNHTETYLVNKYGFTVGKELNFKGDLIVKLLQK